MFFLIKGWKILKSSWKSMEIEKDTFLIEREDFSEEEKNKLSNWYLIDENWEFYLDENQKQELIIEYKNIQKEITDKKSEIQEILDTYDSYNQQGKQIADIQKTKLENDLKILREKKDNLVLSWVEKYWVEVINEL